MTKSPVSLFSHLSAKIREFSELLPTAFRQNTGEPFPVLTLIQYLHTIVLREMDSPDYNEETRKVLKEIRWDLERMASTTDAAVNICRADNLIAFHSAIRGYDAYLYYAAQRLNGYIRKHVDPLIDEMILEAEKKEGKPASICILPYQP